MRSTRRNPHETLMSLLIHAQNRIEKETDQILKQHKSNLKSDHWHILRVLSERDGIPMKDIHAATTINDSTLTKAMDLLISKGLAYRKTSEKDRRKVLIFLSKRGETLTKKLSDEIAERQAEIFPEISQSKLDDITEFLSDIAS